ncbi:MULTISPECIES: serine/threonine-protein kinase [unclassified Methanoregula]|uniref:serine/threonine-protein kinase n=1 Tax=unclassified Methanoregula TaxID=2649730 RepID=UPI0009CE11CC|nr:MULTISPECIES: serine/threonine-protein kinase [unclassified Methanoregula]OPX61567.1 MAG: serine/threonine-protein kinase [Methanoregula sp. PtaB.Bin085]OPY36769.1 MAG: serine/threonine-protein kinase [Methanoregula sp. PtaU1.Bin006]
MRPVSFLTSVLSCLLAFSLAVLPVLALPDGNTTRVTISASAPEGDTYRFGDRIVLSGTNTASGTTYLFLTGPDCYPRGSQIADADPRTTPVRESNISTFRAVSTGTDNRWSWSWDTRHLISMKDGTYTVYAVNSPRDADNLATAVYDSVALNFSSHFLTATVRPADAAQGDIIRISGIATGNPNPGIAVWIIGPEYSDRAVVSPDEKNAYSLELDSATTHLLNGTYHVFVEHPSQNDLFDFDLNGDYVFNNKIRSNIFTFRGNGRLYGEAAYTAFFAALKGPRTDDIIVPLSFTLGTRPVTSIAASGTSPPAESTIPAGNVTGENATPVVSGTPAGPAGTGSLPVTSPTVVTPGRAGSLSGTDVLQAGDNGGYPQLLPLAGILGTVLLAGAGGIILLRRRRAGTVGPDTPAAARFPSCVEDDRNRTGDPLTATTGPASPGTSAAGFPSSPVPAVNAFPEELAGRYTGITPVGSGGFAMVYSAYRISDNRKVAIKIPVRSDERTGKSFLHEIRVWETLHHPNIVEVKEVNILPVPYVEMEYVPGSLEHLEKPLDIMTAARIVRGIADGIRYAHARRCIHRDIKPHNILLTETLVPKITDWGISKILEERAKKTTMAGFSLSYAAPEQIAPERFGSTDERTDIWQIGAVFYELVTGSTPFYADGMMELVDEILEEDPIFPSDYNPKAAPVEHIILKCLAKHPALRYQSAADLLAALDDFLMNP